MKTFLLLSTLLGLAAPGCSNRDNREAKKRVLSPDPQPSPSQKRAAEKLDPADLASDPMHARRVLRMDAGEALERVGPFRYESKVSFAWTMGNQTVKLVEDALLLCGPHGAFHARVNNDDQQGMEVIRFANSVYGRSRFAKLYRSRRLDRGHADQERDEAFSALRTFYDLTGGHVGLKPSADDSVCSRSAKRYVAFLSSQAPTADDPDDLPPIQYAKEGPPEGTHRRFQFLERKKPKSISGEIWIDAETSVPLKATLSAEITAPGENGEEAQLSLEIQTGFTQFGEAVKITPPKNPLPDDVRPAGVAAALERFGLSGGPDGGVKLPEASEEEE